MDFNDNKVIEQIKYIDSDKLHFDILGSLTTGCNYKCPYCVQPFHDNKMNSEENVIATANKINKLMKYHKNRNINVTLIGGEITYYNLTKILDEFDFHISKLIITTNFSQKLDYFKDLYDYCKKRGTGLHIMCSYHEVGDSFFVKYLDLLKGCVETDNPLPVITFVLDNDFDFEIFTRFPEIPKSLLNFNLKQIKSNGGNGLTTLLPSVKEQGSAITKDSGKGINNELIRPVLQKRKNGELWGTKNGRGDGYEVVYDNGEKEHVGNLKSILMYKPDILFSKSRICNAVSSGLFVDEYNNVFTCTTNNTLLTNLNDFDEDEYLRAITNPNNLICHSSPCYLCHNVKIYKNLKLFLEDEFKNTEEDINESN